MNIRTVILSLVMLTLSACGGDGVPELRDPAAPVVDGKSISGSDFVEKYCVGKDANETCAAVKRANVEKISTMQAIPRF